MAGIDFQSTFDADRITEDILRRKYEGMQRAAVFAKGDIIARTLKGEGLNGSFPGYSASYEKVRAAKGLPTGRVDLFFTGDMQGSLHTEVFREGDNLVFEIAPTPDQNTKVVYTHERRPWFDLTEEERARAVRTVEEA